MKKRQGEGDGELRRKRGGPAGRPGPGGKGLTLEAFAAAKSRCAHSPYEIKKQREFYKNASKVRKYKRLKKQLRTENEPNPIPETPASTEKQNEASEAGSSRQKGRKRGFGHNTKIREEYEQRQKEIAEAREKREKELAERTKAKKLAEEKRKQVKAKMFKKTSRGQPVMKHRLDQLLSSIEAGKN